MCSRDAISESKSVISEFHPDERKDNHMDRRAFLKTGAAGAAIALADNFANAASAPSQNSSGTMQPNIIWLFGDQHRAQALSCMGDSNVSTPNIDALAGNGVHLDHAISSMPLCCPFRGSLITGCYPHKSVPGHEYPLPTGTPTIVDPLKAAGYHTGYFGKWHRRLARAGRPRSHAHRAA